MAGAYNAIFIKGCARRYTYATNMGTFSQLEKMHSGTTPFKWCCYRR